MASSTSSSSSSSSTSFRKGTQIQMYIVERFEKRTTGQGGKTREFLKCAVCVKDDKTKIYECFVNDICNMEEKVVNKLLKMSDGAFFAVKNCIVDSVNVKVMVNIKSKVFASGAVFDIPEDLVRAYRRPAIVPLREIRRSPTKKRVSVQGVVSQIGEVRKVGDGKRIRTVELREGDDRVDLNLWGDFSDIEVSMNQHVQASGVVVSEWNNKKRLESSLCSCVEGTEKKNTFEGEVVAVTDEELMVPYEVLMNDSGMEKEVSIVEESQVDADLTHLPCFVRVDVRHEGLSDIVVKMVEVEQK